MALTTKNKYEDLEVSRLSMDVCVAIEMQKRLGGFRNYLLKLKNSTK